MEKHEAELNKFFQQMRCGISGHKSEREELEEQIKKEVINFKDQLKEQLKKDLIEQVEQFEKERLKNEQQLKTELIEYAEQLENKQIVQEEQHEKEITSATLLYYAWKKKNCHKQGHKNDVYGTKYWSERCIPTN